MAVAQSNYGAAPAIGLPGAIANEETFNSISRTVENAEGIGFGQPAFRGTGDHGCAATGSVVLGLAILNRAVPVNEDAPDAYPRYFQAAILTMGQMYVTAGAAVVDGDDVYWIPGTKRFGTSSGGGNVLIPNATFDTSGGDGDIVEVSLKLR